MLHLGLVLLAVMSSQPADVGSQVSVAGGDWSNIPLVKRSGTLRISDDLISKIESAAFGECAKPGQSKTRLDMTIPFLVQFTPEGGVERVVIMRLDCPTIEQTAGGAVLQLARAGEYRPTGENVEGWYRGEIKISLH